MPLPGARRVLAVFAHRDDEALAAGGLLAALAERGVATAVVTATWTEGTARVEQLARALETLGAGQPRLLSYADGRVPSSAPSRSRLVDAPLDEATSRLVEHLRDVRPDVVITHDAHGGLTGHPDHVRTHELTVRAVASVAREQATGDAAESWRVSQVLGATHVHSARPLLERLVGVRRTVHTVPDHTAEAVDVRPWLAAKVAAVLAHRSEVERGALPGLVARMPPSDRELLLGTEWFTPAVVDVRPGGRQVAQLPPTGSSDALPSGS